MLGQNMHFKCVKLEDPGKSVAIVSALLISGFDKIIGAHMKYLLSILLIVFSLRISAQPDSATLRFEYVDEDLAMVNRLIGVQMIKVVCTDTTVIGKRFFLSIDEFENGELVSEFELVSSCDEERIPIVMDGDTAYYIINPCDDIAFNKAEKEMKIKLAGEYENDQFELMIRYPVFSQTRMLTGDDSYSLRKVHATPSGELMIPLGDRIPILTYTPPFKAGGGLSSYCLLGEEEVDKWHEKFNVEHYYVFYLKIE